MKKTTIILGIFASSIPPQVKAEPLNSSSSGLSVLFQGGYSAAEAKTNRNTVSRVAALNNIKDRTNISVKGATIGAGLLYGHLFQNLFYAGIEFNGLFSNFKGKANTTVNYGEPIQTSFKMKNSFGSSLRLGYCINQWLPYIKLGISKSKWTSKTELLPIIGKGHNSKSLNAYTIGVGLEVPLNERFAVGGEISRVGYKKLSYDVRDNRNIKTMAVKASLSENRLTAYLKVKLTNSLIN